MIGKKLTALHQSHRMRMNFLEGTPVIIRQAADAMLYMKFMFSHNSRAALPQQLIVVKQTSRNRILYGTDTNHGWIALDILKHPFEGGATYQLYLLTLEILMGSDVVERSQLSLYCYSLHCLVSYL